MKQIKLTVPYKLKKFIPMLAIAAAPFTTSCDKEDPQHDVILEFHKCDYSALSIENVTKHANDPTVRTIYMKARDNDNCTAFATHNINRLRNSMQERLDISPKVRGMGNFCFKPGVATPEDSLFFVRNGWTINTPPYQYQRQR